MDNQYGGEKDKISKKKKLMDDEKKKVLNEKKKYYGPVQNQILCLYITFLK